MSPNIATNQKRSQALSALSVLQGVPFKIEGSLYAFPRIYLSDKAIEEAEKRGLYPDEFYCKEALSSTGIFLDAGSIFGLKKPPYHFRIST
jgi:alanine transaminase